MRKSFLGTGWRFPVGVDGSGGLGLAAERESIEQAIRLILGTAVGERVMRPDFGCYIHDYVFHPNNASTAALISYHSRSAIGKWEPRVRNVEVMSYPDENNESTMLVDIRYEIISRNQLENMVFPFYLRREQDL